jgi:hypothetical protein
MLTESFGAIPINPLVLSSFVRMTVGSRGMFVGKLAMSRSGVLLRLFVLAKIVVMGRLMMMMCGGERPPGDDAHPPDASVT